MHLRHSTLIDFSRRELSGRTRRRAARHLEACTLCRRRLAFAESLRTELTNLPGPRAPERFDEVLRRLDEGDVVLLPEGRIPARRPRVRRGAVAAVVVGLLSAAGLAAAVIGHGVRFPGASAEPAEPAVAGLSVVLPDRPFVVDIGPGARPIRVTVTLSDDDALEVTAHGGERVPGFRSFEDRLVLEGASGGSVEVALPRSGPAVTVRSGTRVLAVARGGLLAHSGSEASGAARIVVELPPAGGPGGTP